MEPLRRARCSCRTHHSPRAVRRPSGAPAPALTLSYLPGSFPPSWPLAVVLLCLLGHDWSFKNKHSFVHPGKALLFHVLSRPIRSQPLGHALGHPRLPATLSQQPRAPTAGVGLLGDHDRLTTTSRAYNVRAAEYLWQE